MEIGSYGDKEAGSLEVWRKEAMEIGSYGDREVGR